MPVMYFVHIYFTAVVSLGISATRVLKGDLLDDCNLVNKNIVPWICRYMNMFFDFHSDVR